MIDEDWKIVKDFVFEKNFSNNKIAVWKNDGGNKLGINPDEGNIGSSLVTCWELYAGFVMKTFREKVMQASLLNDFYIFTTAYGPVFNMSKIPTYNFPPNKLFKNVQYLSYIRQRILNFFEQHENYTHLIYLVSWHPVASINYVADILKDISLNKTKQNKNLTVIMYGGSMLFARLIPATNKFLSCNKEKCFSLNKMKQYGQAFLNNLMNQKSRYFIVIDKGEVKCNFALSLGETAIVPTLE